MDSLEEKLGEITSNPKLMQQIMELAQSLGQNTQQSPPDPPKASSAPASGFDANALNKLGALVKRSNIDSQQQTLLKALSPYLSRNKLAKLERAMQAARMADAASALIHSGSLPLFHGR